MTTSTPLSSSRPADSLSSREDRQSGDRDNGSSPSALLGSAQRIAASAQPSRGGGLVSPQSTPKTGWTSPTFAVVKSTVMQQAIGHPLLFVRTLMQMGYEPIPAVRATNLFGKEAYYYPNAFRYLKYVYKIDGFTGLYRGFGCSLVSKVVCWYTTTQVDELLGTGETQGSNERETITWHKCVQKTLREVRCQSWGILVSHPFHVMAVRTMAQFVGREETYSSINIFKNAHEIFTSEGVGGFFVGLIPRWLMEVAMIVISNVLVHLLKSQLPPQQELVPLYEYMASFVAQTVTYPFNVVTTVTALHRSGLVASMPPLMPLYANWQDAYKQLGRDEQLKRGAGLFNRTAHVVSAGTKPTGLLVKR